ncbi:MAG TPA: DUF4397 domain-containing protein, partial [Gammaproteobacteria bacterium]|nr:DUF4397 domain-containing protein [Gammaproteobacteria bacterium]
IGGEAVSAALAALGFAVPADFGCNPINPTCPPTSIDDLYYYVSGSNVYVRHWIEGVQQDPIRDLPYSLELPFWLWDFDENGVPDSIQLELLTELLCLPEGIEHPLVNVSALREVMINNEAEYEEFIYQFFAIQSEMEAAWPLFSQRPEIPNGIGWQMRANWVTAGISSPTTTLLNDPLIFLSGTIPEPFQGITWNELAYFLIDIGDAFEMILENWNIAQSALNNQASIQLFAAVFGMFDIDMWSVLMEEDVFRSLDQAMYLTLFDWEYLLNKFGMTGLSAEELETAVDGIGLYPGLLPSQETASEFDWGTILDGYTEEGEFVNDVVGDTFLTTSARVVQASPDAPAVDICQNGVALFDNLLFKDISAYAEITAPHPDFLYEFAVVPAGDDCSAYVLSDNLDMPNTSTLVALNTYENLEFL